MAESKKFICNKCNHIITSWSDGNPYYINNLGSKKYAYHPDKKLSLCIGNDQPSICLSCGYEFMNDTLKEITECPKCRSKLISNTFYLENKVCPFCNSGEFISDPSYSCIS